MYLLCTSKEVLIFRIHFVIVIVNIIFNSKKTVCIKFGSTIIKGESAFFEGVMLEWTDKVRHLGNFIDTTCTDYIDCIANKSYFRVVSTNSKFNS